jgi:long-chain acyl-CoA synthetase
MDFNPNDLTSVIKSAEFKKFLMEDIAALSKANKLSGLEKPRDIYISAEGFSVDNNMMTPTFKLKRNVAREFFRKEIDVMYSKQ